jgi:hypothetical protein
MPQISQTIVCRISFKFHRASTTFYLKLNNKSRYLNNISIQIQPRFNIPEIKTIKTPSVE